MKRTLAYIAWVGAVALASCAAAPTSMQFKFSSADHDAYLLSGANNVTGQASLPQPSGGTVTCAGSNVLLFPATAFFKEAVAIGRDGGKPDFDSSDPKYQAVFRTSSCDAQGAFAFEKVPAGNYIIGAIVRWSVGDASQGGELFKEVKIEDGVTNHFSLGDQD